MSLKKRVEAVVFSSGRYVSVERIAKLCRADVDVVTNILNELKKDYEARESSLILTNEGGKWKLTVKEKFIPTVRRIVAEAELTKAVMQTLAYIAYKAPILQSDVVSVRSNKAYNHIAELESKGFLTKTKHGHSFLIKLTQKFFDYFDLKSKEDIQKRFGRVKELTPEEVLLREVEKKWEKTEEPKVEIYGKPEVKVYGKKTEEIEELEEKEGEERGEEEQSQIDELRKEQKEKVIEKEVKKIEEHFNNMKKGEKKEKEKTNDIVNNKNKK